MVTASWICLITAGFDIRATPPCARISAGTRSSAITATAPASSAIFAWSAVVTSMITPPLSISASPVFTLNVARSAIAHQIVEGGRRNPGYRPETWGAGLPGWRAGNLFPTSPVGGMVGEMALEVWGPLPRTPVSATGPDRPPGLWLLYALLQLEGADPVAVSRLVTRVDAIRQRLDQAHQGGVRPDVRGPVGGVVEHQLRVLRHVRERRVCDRERPGAPVTRELERPQDEGMCAPRREHHQQGVLVHPRELLDVVLARGSDDLRPDVEQA